MTSIGQLAESLANLVCDCRGLRGLQLDLRYSEAEARAAGGRRDERVHFAVGLRHGAGVLVSDLQPAV